jgi:chemotaxis protein methyltransferase CheR
MTAPALKPATPAISREDLAAFAEFFCKKTGIRVDESRRYYIERRIADRMLASDCRTFREYFAFVRYDVSGQELQLLINEMTVNETYFYREDYQFQALVQHMLDEIADARPSQPIRIWSVPCSTGEEPYSLAIWILEHWRRADAFDIEIHASDIDSRALARAREGYFDARSVQRLPEALRRKYFEGERNGRWRICSTLRDSIEFTPANISDSVEMAKRRDFDVIFCRNLLIYFDDQSRRQAMAGFYEALRPGGFICLGHSESMSRMSGLFLPRKFPEALVHQRPFA